MNTGLVELLRNGLPAFLSAIVRVVNDDLSSIVEKVPDLLLAPCENLFPELDGLQAFLALWQL